MQTTASEFVQLLHNKRLCVRACRLVKVDLEEPGAPESWDDLIPQHDTDLLQWASAHEVEPASWSA